MGLDPTFELDDFKKAKLLTETESRVRCIIMILFGKPGFYPSIPELGMNIQQYLYSVIDDSLVDKLKAELAYQCREFMPDIEDGSIDMDIIEEDGRCFLLIRLPSISNGDNTTVSLGVTLNDKGEMIYNFEESDINISL